MDATATTTSKFSIANLNTLMAKTSEFRAWKLNELLKYKLGYDEYWILEQFDDGWGVSIEWDEDGGRSEMASATHTSMIGAIRRCLFERLKSYAPEETLCTETPVLIIQPCRNVAGLSTSLEFEYQSE